MDDESAVKVHFFMPLGVESKCGLTLCGLLVQTTMPGRQLSVKNSLVRLRWGQANTNGHRGERLSDPLLAVLCWSRFPAGKNDTLSYLPCNRNLKP